MVRGGGVKTPKSSAFRGVTLFRPTGKWRAQISAWGKTTSLGDHDTEEQAARAFDKAVINKDGWEARTNFPLKEYGADEVEYIHGLPHAELVALLRDAARKCGNTSSFTGVSLLKPTGKWNAQICFSDKQLQVHLGLHQSEEDAARAYDRAAIFQALREGTSPDTNFDIQDYEDELNHLSTITEDDLVSELISRSAKSAKTAIGEPRPAAKPKGNVAAEKSEPEKVEVTQGSSRPPSPSTPQFSTEGERDGLSSEFGLKLAAPRGCISIASGGVTKRTLNRRARSQPVRAYLG